MQVTRLNKPSVPVPALHLESLDDPRRARALQARDHGDALLVLLDQHVPEASTFAALHS